MTDRIDHAAEALALLRRVSGSRMSDGEASVSVSAAQAEANLALVEQARLANLIALATYTEGDEIPDLLRAEAQAALAPWVPTDPDDEYPQVRPEVAAALGLD